MWNQAFKWYVRNYAPVAFEKLQPKGWQQKAETCLNGDVEQVSMTCTVSDPDSRQYLSGIELLPEAPNADAEAMMIEEIERNMRCYDFRYGTDFVNRFNKDVPLPPL